MRNIEVMEFRTVVVADQTGHLLEMFRLEIDQSGGAETMSLLSPGHQCLAKQAADRFATIETQVAGTCSQAEKFFRPGRAQPLEIQRQLRAVKVFAAGCW